MARPQYCSKVVNQRLKGRDDIKAGRANNRNEEMQEARRQQRKEEKIEDKDTTQQKRGFFSKKRAKGTSSLQLSAKILGNLKKK